MTIQRLFLWLPVGVFALAIHANAEELVLAPIMDGSIYEDDADLSNSSGQHLFSGATAFRNSGFQRRALLAFDVASSVPANATITGASLSLTVNRVPGPDNVFDFGLHAITSNWNEGATDAGGQEGKGAAAVGDDVTWTRTGFGDWNTEGGDFVAEPSAVTEVNDRGSYTWSSDLMASNIQSWITDPESNAGWILVGMGDPLLPFSAKRFASRENPDEATRPSLTIQYELSETLLGDYDADGELTEADIGYVCSAVQGGLNPVEFDLNGDEIVDLGDLEFWVERVKGTFMGDTDLNGTVEFKDFIVLSDSFGQFPGAAPDPIPENYSAWSFGDMNCDAAVSFGDFLVIAENFGQSNGQTLGTVPEPSTYALFVFTLFAVGRFRRSRDQR